MIHAAQVNEEEAAILTSDKLDEESLAKHTLALNTGVLLVTRGERGCTAFIDDHKHIRRVDEPGIPVEGTSDPTGCGDVFGAAYCAHYVNTKDAVSSAAFANKIASLNAGITGSEQIDTISSQRLSRSTPELRTA
jgi:sugar/nucleoside kinase (ribokinase family)